MKIYPIVEGYGETDAVPILLRRLRDDAATYQVEVGKAIRRKRSEFTQEDPVRRAVRLAAMQPECAAVLVLFDADDDCPAETAGRVLGWVRNELMEFPCAVVMANREFEAWFLASMVSLRGKRGIAVNAEDHPNPDSPRNAKRELELRMSAGRSYSETIDQSALAAQFDLAIAYQRSRSFRKLVKSFGELINSIGHTPAAWPPPAWACAV